MARWAEQTELDRFIPKTARTVVFARNLHTMVETLAFASENLPGVKLGPARGAWKEALDVDLLSTNSLEELGMSSTSPAALFYDRGYWVVAAKLYKPEALERALGKKPEDLEKAGVSITSQDYGSMELAKLTIGEEHSGFVAHDDDTILLAVRVEKSSLGSADTLPKAWRPESQKARFLDDGLHRKLVRDLSISGELVAVVRPAAWLANREAEGHAGVLLGRILGQMGPVGLAANSVSLDESVNIKLLTPGNPRAPTMISSLGRAEGELPPVGGLIQPGVLGVGRLSVDPSRLYELMTSAMPAARRTEMQEYWDRLDRELRVNAQRDVLENLRGHAVVVAYGLDRDALEDSQAPWYLDLAKLEATREAVLLPIKEREPLEQVLNALTTVTKGKLSRQKVGHTLQYAWLEQGELKWAVILSDENLIYVDSSVAFEHASDYERSGRPLGEKLGETGISRLFQMDDAAGIYVDTASLHGILAEGESGRMLGWLAPFRSAVVTTREEGATGVTEIHLEVAEASD